MNILKKCSVVIKNSLLVVSLLLLFSCNNEKTNVNIEIGMKKLKIFSIKNGNREWTLYASSAFSDYAKDTLFLNEVELLYGEDSVYVKSESGFYNQKTGGLYLSDSVVIVTPERDTVFLKYLVYDPQLKEIKSDSTVIIKEKNNILQGTSFRSDENFENITIGGKVCLQGSK